MSLVTGFFCLVLRLSPPLRLQVAHCSTFRILRDVPSIIIIIIIIRIQAYDVHAIVLAIVIVSYVLIYFQLLSLSTTIAEQRIRRGIQESTCIQFLGVIIRCDTVALRLIIAVKCRVCSCVGLRENITIIIVLALSPDVCALALSQESSNFYDPASHSVKPKPKSKFAAASPLHTAKF